MLYLKLPIIKLQPKRIKTEKIFTLSYLNSNLALTLGYLNPALNNSAQKWINIHLCSFKLFQGVISVRAFYLTAVISALSNEVIWDSFRCPSKLSQTRMDFLVQWSDSLPEQSTFFRWQNSNDSVDQVKTKYVSTFLLAFALSDNL